MNLNQSTITQIELAESQLAEAMKSADLKGLDLLFHDDLAFNIPGGFTLTKAQDMENYRSGAMTLTGLHFSNRQIQSFEDVAVVAVSVKMEGDFKGQSLTGDYKILRVWKQFGIDWKVIGGSSVPI